MEHLSVGILFVAFASFCFLLLNSRHKAKLPPSPRGLPIIGHLHLLGKLPHQSLLKLSQEHGTYMLLRLGQIKTLVVSSSEGARQVLKTYDHVFASRPLTTAAQIFGYGGRDMAWAPYGDHWRGLRKLCTLELLTAKRVEMFKPIRKVEVEALLSGLLNSANDKTSVNVSEMVSDTTFNVMLRLIMNKSFTTSSNSDKKRALLFKQTINEAFALASGTHIGDFIPYLRWMDTQVYRMKVIKQIMDDFMQKEVEEHRERWIPHESVAQDFMDVMLASGVSNDTTMKGLALDIVSAGTDTSAMTVDWALSELIMNPNLMKKAQDELDEVIGNDRVLDESDIPKLTYLNAVIKETMRLPLLLPHESLEDCTVGEFVIPAKTRLIVNAYGIARDPAVWDEPLKFNPDRFLGEGKSIDVRGQNFEFIPFGSGRRVCPGLLLGMTTVHLLLGSLLHSFDWSLPNGCKELDMTEVFGLTLPRAKPLVLLPSLRLSKEAIALR